MALSERLALIVDLDAKGAVQGLTNIGKAAEQQLGKADDRLSKMGRTATRAGIGMIGAGAVIGGALFKAAQASEDANLSVVKLNNSLKGNPRLVGESAESFIDLANAIQKKTAADADEIVAGQSMLATFRVTGDQIKALTPLVVDYARKFGVDMVSANAAVGKALDGQVGALKRNGVSIDETLYKTDRFAAVQKALAQQVGGFAEAEGKTFAGSLERIKNQLGDIVEGVGGGAVDAFSDMLTPVSKLAEGFGDLDPKVQSSVGKLATFGAAGLLLVGTASTVVGKLLTMRQNFADLAVTAPRASKALGIAGKAIGVLGAAAAAYELIQLANAANQVSVDVDEMAAALAKGPFDQAGRDAITAADHFGKLDDIVRKVAETNPVVADGFIKQAEAAGISKDKIAALKDIVSDQRDADKAGAAATKEYGDEMSAAADGVDDLTDANNGLLASMQAVYDATLAQFDSNLAYRNAVDEVSDKITELAEKQKEGKLTAEELDDANRGIESSLLSQAAAAVKAADDQAAAAGKTLTAAEKTTIYKGELQALAEKFPGLSGLIQGYIDKLNRIPLTITTEIVQNIQQRYKSLTTAEILGGKVYGRASGGPMWSGTPYLVGEHGPELFTPYSNGSMTTTGRLNSGGSNVSIGDINVHVGAGAVADPRRLAADLFTELQLEVRRRGGDVQQALGSR